MSLGITITSAGATAPDLPTIVAALTASYQGIFGSDAVLDPSTQDGQWIAVMAAAINDANQGGLAVYNSYSPTTAQGAGLSSIVKINGIARLVPTASTAVVTIVGTAGVVINNGRVGDNQNLGTQWALPPLVTIPPGGAINVTATCTTLGATPAGPGTLTAILNPSQGWQTVTNAGAATVGSPVETDAVLRARQSVSSSLPALTVQESIFANVASVPGVTRLAMYDNDTSAPDSNGVAAHSFAIVTQGGSAAAIAAAIAATKAPGSGTYATGAGAQSIAVVDKHGVTNTINFMTLIQVVVTVQVTIKALAGYVSSTTPLIQAAIAYFISTLSIGEISYLNRLMAPANLSGDVALAGVNAYLAAQSPPQAALTQVQLDALAVTYNVTLGLLKQSRPSTAPPSVQDIAIAFNEGAISSGATASFTGSITTTVLTVSAMGAGSPPLAVGQVLAGSVMAANTIINSFGSGVGGTGTYNVSVSQSVASEAMTASQVLVAVT